MNNPTPFFGPVTELSAIKGGGILKAIKGGFKAGSPKTMTKRDKKRWLQNASNPFAKKQVPYAENLAKAKEKIANSKRKSLPVFIDKNYPKSGSERDILGRFGKSLDLRAARTNARIAQGEKIPNTLGPKGQSRWTYNKNSPSEISYQRNLLRRKIERRPEMQFAAVQAITELGMIENMVKGGKALFRKTGHFMKNPRDLVPVVRISRSKNKLKAMAQNPRDILPVARYQANEARAAIADKIAPTRKKIMQKYGDVKKQALQKYGKTKKWAKDNKKGLMIGGGAAGLGAAGLTGYGMGRRQG